MVFFFSCINMFSLIFNWSFYMFYIWHAIPSALFSRNYSQSQAQPFIFLFLNSNHFKPPAFIFTAFFHFWTISLIFYEVYENLAFQCWVFCCTYNHMLYMKCHKLRLISVNFNITFFPHKHLTLCYKNLNFSDFTRRLSLKQIFS